MQQNRTGTQVSAMAVHDLTHYFAKVFLLGPPAGPTQLNITVSDNSFGRT
jgi:hypothetical protein